MLKPNPVVGTHKIDWGVLGFSLERDKRCHVRMVGFPSVYVEIYLGMTQQKKEPNGSHDEMFQAQRLGVWNFRLSHTVGPFQSG